MLTLRLTDNNYYGSPLCLYDEKGTLIDFPSLPDCEKSAVRKALSEISDIPLSKLAEIGAIIFPDQNAESDLNGGKIVLSVQNLMSENPIIRTTNIMGFFTVGKTLNIEIRSRFDKSSKQFFLHYMLQKACNAAPTMERKQTNKNPLYSFAVYLFPTFLQRAMAQGTFKTYVNRAYNDSHIRGAIDFPHHFRLNIPFNGKIAYKSREFSQNNPLAHLVRHTIEHIGERHTNSNLLSAVRSEVSEIRSYTENYRREERNIIIAKNAKGLANAFYSEYENLRKLCRIILLAQKNAYINSSNHLLNGILFDGASLWEEYLNVILKEQIQKNHRSIILEHPNNRTGKGAKYLFKTANGEKKGEIFPDFLLKNADGKHIAIFDAKYKQLENKNAANNDYFQMLAYMFRFGCKHGSLMYPCIDGKKSETILYLAGQNEDTTIFQIGLAIPQQCERYTDFFRQMKTAEENVLQKIFAFAKKAALIKLRG